MENIRFRQASAQDLSRILEIIRQAQRRMAAAGSRQWQDGYPAPENITSDLEHGYGYVLCCQTDKETEGVPYPGKLPLKQSAGERDNIHPIVAYGAVVFDGEAAYDALDGEWLTEGPYVVVHRLAVADEALGEGLGTKFLKQVEGLARIRGIEAFRIDTNFDNVRMLRILANQGFTRCGKVVYRSGEREAFEKRLEEGFPEKRLAKQRR